MITIKRIYDAHETADGSRILIDRLWPRGVGRNTAAIDRWAKAIAPSSELRRWYNHEPSRWLEFQERYALELAAADAVEELLQLRTIAAQRNITLLTATRSETGTHALVVRRLLLE